MSETITNYDGSIVMTPQEVLRPTSVEELQAILRDTDRYPGPVRAMGSNHSLTPCAASPGTIARRLLEAASNTVARTQLLVAPPTTTTVSIRRSTR